MKDEDFAKYLSEVVTSTPDELISVTAEDLRELLDLYLVDKAMQEFNDKGITDLDPQVVIDKYNKLIREVDLYLDTITSATKSLYDFCNSNKQMPLDSGSMPPPSSRKKKEDKIDEDDDDFFRGSDGFFRNTR